MANTLAFAVCLAVWVIFGPTGRAVADELGLSPGRAALLKSTPILIGSLARIPVGLLSDRFGARLLFPVLMAASAGALLAMSWAHSFSVMLAAAVVLGLAGASFAVGAQSVSAWTAPSRQGTALGIFGAGNAGMALATLALPLLLDVHGWRVGFRICGAVLALTLVGYALVVRNPPRHGPRSGLGTLMAPLAQARTWRLGFYYMACFGVVVGGTLVLGDLYVDGYGVSPTDAGYLVTTFTVTASLMRIVGGRLADSHGPLRVVQLSLLVAGIALAPVGLGMPLSLGQVAMAMFAAGLSLGMSMAATMKCVAVFFPTGVGTVGGILGALGGVGGFLLAIAGQTTRRLWPHPFAEVLPMVLLIGAALLVLWRSRAVEVQQPRGTMAVG